MSMSKRYLDSIDEANNVEDKELTYIYDYAKDIEKDKELQNILVLSENLLYIEIDDKTEDMIMYCITFLTDKIDEIDKIAKSFGFRIRQDRLTNVARVLDDFTTEEYDMDYLESAELKFSLLLDLLSSELNIFLMFYKYNFESKNK